MPQPSPMGGWSVRDLSDLVSARSGGGGVWEYSGELVALGSGRVLAGIRGIEEIVQDSPVQRVAPESELNELKVRPLSGSPPRATHPALTHASRLVTRKTLFYVDPLSGDKMDVFRFRPTAPPRPVFPILSPAAMLQFALDAKSQLVLLRGLTGADPRLVVPGPPIRPFGAVLSAAWTYVGRSAAQTSAKTPNKPGVVEEYHLVAGKDGGAATWVRYGKCPSWYSGGQCIMSLRSVRVKDGRQGLDKRLQSWLTTVDRQKPLCAQDAVRAPSERPQQGLTRRAKFLGIL
jgi:hypothetical protein